MNRMDQSFWRNRKVLITGHTGFKGGWLTKILHSLGSKIVGVSNTDMGPLSLYNILGLNSRLSNTHYGLNQFIDLLDENSLQTVFQKFNPEIVFHLAAQPIVINSYKEPYLTHQTNFIGTLNILEASRKNANLSVFISVTTDKVYHNNGDIFSFRETDALGGHDPYSASKACADILTQSYFKSFFNELNIGVASARAGNVIGGGDWAENRLIPDIVRSAHSNEKLVIRNPSATRPWQHVLEPLSGYILLAQKLHENPQKHSSPINFGPKTTDVLTVSEVLKLFSKFLDKKVSYEIMASTEYHEAKFLSLDCSTANFTLGWRPTWNAETAIRYTAEWYNAFENRNALEQLTTTQIERYQSNRTGQ